MSIQEKINKRIEQLEVELSQAKEVYYNLTDLDWNELPDNYSQEVDLAEFKVELVSRCVQELKQLLNN